MDDKILQEYQGPSIKINGECYLFVGETTAPVDTDPSEVGGTFSSCLECALESSSSDSSESIGNTSSSSSSSSGFFPYDIPGLSLWYDASDTDTITDSGGFVSQWDDKSGNNFHVTQGTGSNQPQTELETQNNLNTLTFDGSNDFLQRNSINVTDMEWVFAAVIVKSGQPNTGCCSGLVSNAGDRGNIRLASGTVAAWRPTNDANDFCYTDGDFEVNGVASASFTFDQIQVSKFQRGSTIAGSVYNNIRIGGDPISGNVRYLKMALCELIFYNEDLTSSEQDTVINYLNNKWVP